MGSGSAIPRYAILSHTGDVEEVTFQDFTSEKKSIRNRMKGFEKIRMTCQLSLEHGCDYCRVDTCCIDKTSSAELSEAINSMYRRYQKAETCFVWLSDLALPLKVARPSWKELRECRWLTRGWTLQELVAPFRVIFYDRSWKKIGTKVSMAECLAKITSIAVGLIESRTDLGSYSVAQKMSWAAKRCTTRVEDRAYSLLGIFDVNMPLLYGEGSKAFLRLQHEIVRSTTDTTVFAWTKVGNAALPGVNYGAFTQSPGEFARASTYVLRDGFLQSSEYSIKNKGLRVKASIRRRSGGIWLWDVASCEVQRSDPRLNVRSICLDNVGRNDFQRVDAGQLDETAPDEVRSMDAESRVNFICGRTQHGVAPLQVSSHSDVLEVTGDLNFQGDRHDLHCSLIMPAEHWDGSHNAFIVRPGENFAGLMILDKTENEAQVENASGGSSFGILVGKDAYDCRDGWWAVVVSNNDALWSLDDLFSRRGHKAWECSSGEQSDRWYKLLSLRDAHGMEGHPELACTAVPERKSTFVVITRLYLTREPLDVRMSFRP